MIVYQIDYVINKNFIRQIIKYYAKMKVPYKIFININSFNIGFNKNKKTLDEALNYCFETLNKAHSPNFWIKPSYMKMFKLPDSDETKYT